MAHQNHCPKHGPLTPHDIVTETDFDPEAGTILSARTCSMCGSTVRRLD